MYGLLGLDNIRDTTIENLESAKKKSKYFDHL